MLPLPNRHSRLPNMHEMSLAMNIADLAVQTATREGARRIASVELEIERLAGVMAEALSF
jgi:Zn finger protein HypA/HybF involved in hydrogenase expression